MARREGRRDRRHRRYDLEGVTGSLRLTTEVRILNISVGGMQVETTSHLTVGRRYRFRLRRDERELDLEGRVAWCILSGTRRVDEDEVVPYYTAGIAFDGSLTDDGEALVDFIDETLVIEFERRVFGRFRPPGEDDVTADSHHELIVKKISLSGMLVETDLVPEVESRLSMEVVLGEETFHSEVRVAYVNELDGEEGRAELGVEYLDLSDEQALALTEFIEAAFTREDPDV